MPNSTWQTFWRKHTRLKQALSHARDAVGSAPDSVTKCALPSQGCTIGIGHSHLMTFVYAQQARIEQAQPMNVHFHWIQLQDEDLNPNLVENGGRVTLNPVLRRRLDRELATLREAPPFLCASISGNEFLYVGHTEHPRRFDFSLPERPDLTVRSGVEIIPPSLMRKTLERSMQHPLSIMTALREATDIPIVFIQSPPPVMSGDFISGHAGPFREAIEENGVAPPSLRMKLWLLQSAIYRQRGEELGCRYFEIPEEVLDASGFLQETGSWPDSVHANAWYGEILLQKFEGEFRQSQPIEVSR